jgi:tRNA-dihydrouridine synthase
VVQVVKGIPVIGNGDIITPQAAKKMFDETGCAGVSIGRGAFYNPWIFQNTLEYLKGSNHRQVLECCSPLPLSNGSNGSEKRQRTGALQDAVAMEASLSEPPFAERVRIMCRHLDLMVEVFGEELGCRMFRKVAPMYSRRFGPVSEFNKHVVLISTRAQFHDVLKNYLRWRQQFLDEAGELQSRYRPPPMVASFMQEPGDATVKISVPKGPVEVW